MATRRLTDAFLLLRNNSIQNRQPLAEQVSSHTTSSPCIHVARCGESPGGLSDTRPVCTAALPVCLSVSVSLFKKENKTSMEVRGLLAGVRELR